MNKNGKMTLWQELCYICRDFYLSMVKSIGKQGFVAFCIVVLIALLFILGLPAILLEWLLY